MFPETVATGKIGIFLGITNESAYCILKISDNKVYMSRNVSFFENKFPTLNDFEESNNMIPNTSWVNFVEEEDKFYNFLQEVEEQASLSKDHSEDKSIPTNPFLRFEQLDIKSAFLNAPFEDEVYFFIPQGLDRNKKKVSKADSCIFYHNGNEPIWLFVHVDNIGVFGKNLTKFKTAIEVDFSTKILGLDDFMLGIKLTHEKNSITLSQCHYINSLLDLYSMNNCKPVATALMPNTHLEVASDEYKKDYSALNVNYCSAIGILSYLSTATRPHLSFVVSAFSQFLESPGTQHWHTFLHVLKYLKGKCSIRLTYCRNNQEPPTAYSDADWGNCRVSR
ncbi:hypothetical protein O181_087073 [Austropuccinia psidii MF-1]|uniref:Reverse transcriptase Ty1/copia-type domain-containing protein n=1 Tax=Austropuccinia psidii MF-1 TaxID=1389203 RepID=A0A9Q3IP03_9BASI|nr:hypothetical protein [Austropuccinia psidii MF-1]